MLNRLSDFYRVAYPEPSDALIRQRAAAITAFLEQLSSPQVQYACGDIAVFGLGTDATSYQRVVATSIVEAIKLEQPSFSSDINANALDLRVFAGVAVAEYLLADDTESTAGLVITALATTPPPDERYLAEFLAALLETAQNSFEKAGRAQRERPELPTQKISGDDPATVALSATKAIENLTNVFDFHLKVDREELDILWWVFGGRSETLDKPFQDLDVCQRAVLAGTELAKRVILPPARASAQFIRAILKEDRLLTLRQLMEPCGPEILRAVPGSGTQVGLILKTHPSLLPFTWLSGRRLESGMSPGWEVECAQRTHLSVDEERTASNWALQVFNECVATRLLDESDNDDEEPE